MKSQATALEEAANGKQFRLSEPPEPVSQPVQVVSESPSVSQSSALGQETSSQGDSFKLSTPPPPLSQPVQVVQADSGGSSAQSISVGEEIVVGLPTSLKEADYNEDIGNEADPEQAHAEPQATAAIDNQEIYRMVREVALADSGEDLYSAVSADEEFDTPGQPAYRRRHFGICFGLVLFSQESGHLGSVLKLMQKRDADAFRDIFGPHADDLLAITNAKASEERLQPVGGEPLWSPSWVQRFQQAGSVYAFQAAQNEEAIERQFRPMLNVARELGFTTDRGLAMVYDRVVTRGLGGGLRWVVQAAGPLRTAAQRDHALRMLGFNDVAQFQATVAWLPKSGKFGPETHAALVGALRRQGQATLPTAQDLMCGLVATATGPAKVRLSQLRDSTTFSDVAYSLN